MIIAIPFADNYLNYAGPVSWSTNHGPFAKTEELTVRGSWETPALVDVTTTRIPKFSLWGWAHCSWGIL